VRGRRRKERRWSEDEERSRALCPRNLAESEKRNRFERKNRNEGKA